MKRVLLKLSGEALTTPGQFGLDAVQISAMVQQIVAAAKQKVEIAIVVGGGNFLRGATASNTQLTRMTADQMGMLATVLNGLALRDAIVAAGCEVELFSALAITGIAPAIDIRRARKVMAKSRVVIFAGGTGNPFVTTDSTASLRAIEIEADLLLKATKVDGVYDKDPSKYKDAKRFVRLSFDDALERRLAVMDIGAFSQCRDYRIPIRVFDLFKPGALQAALLGAEEGSLIT